jgi:hypothetical protein
MRQRERKIAREKVQGVQYANTHGSSTVVKSTSPLKLRLLEIHRVFSVVSPLPSLFTGLVAQVDIAMGFNSLCPWILCVVSKTGKDGDVVGRDPTAPSSARVGFVVSFFALSLLCQLNQPVLLLGLKEVASGRPVIVLLYYGSSWLHVVFIVSLMIPGSRSRCSAAGCWIVFQSDFR